MLNYKAIRLVTLKKNPESHTTLIGSISTGLPGSDILSSESVPDNKESTENAIHN